jgi:enoyl-CoA hydratase
MSSLNIWLAYLGFTFKGRVTCPSSPAKMTKSISAPTNALDHAASYMDADQFMLCQMTQDRGEAIAAFLEKRKPKFKGQ